MVKAISGKGVQKGGFLVPRDKIKKLIEYKHLLSTKQKQDILNALQSGSGVRIKPTKTQSGGFLGSFSFNCNTMLIIPSARMIGNVKIKQIEKWFKL